MGASRKVGGRRLAGCFLHVLENNLTCSDGDVSIFLARRCCMLALMWKVLWGACGGRVELWFALSISGRDPGLFNLREKKAAITHTDRCFKVTKFELITEGMRWNYNNKWGELRISGLVVYFTLHTFGRLFIIYDDTKSNFITDKWCTFLQ